MTATDHAARRPGPEPQPAPEPAPEQKHSGLPARIWPLTARAVADGGISVGGITLAAIAARYGTPAYVLDEDDVRQRCREYRQALPDAEIAYAGSGVPVPGHGALGG
jgi:diaminopimelate decarboxylase